MLSKSEMKYYALMEVAEREFIKHGYRAVSMDDIAKKANISKMTIYKHFASKEELFLTILLHLIDRHFERLEADIRQISGTLEKINLMMNYSLQQLSFYSLDLYQDTVNMPEILEKLIQVKTEKSIALFREIIVDGIEKGELKDTDPDFLADTLITMIEVFSRKYMKNMNSGEDIETFTKQAYSILKHGLIGGAEASENEE